MKLIIAGCGRVGAELANNAANKGHDVNVIDIEAEAFHRLGDSFRGRTIQGDVRDRTVLIRAGIEEADGFAAVTPRDDINLVAAQAADKLFQVANVVAAVYNPDHSRMFSLSNLQTVIATTWGAYRMEQLLTHPGSLEISCLGNGEVRLLEIQIPAHMQGMTIADITGRCQCVPTALIRGGEAALINPSTSLEQGDLLVIAIESTYLPEMNKLLDTEEN